ncbi:MAG: hypothetical protein KME45_18595 [Stenomitos rutilans HA7619-LM2]|nr:hypothetical protein [Stenomitos rutilans HA7619-LM2]
MVDVLLIFSLDEVCDDECEAFEEVVPLNAVNAWLAEYRFTSLVNLDQYVNTGKAMTACVYGGAYNFLKIDEFIEVVREQPWREPNAVQLLIKHGPDDERFTMYTLSD